MCGGPIIPAIVLALNWSKPQSLARRQAMIATIMWVVVLAIYVPAVIRMAATGGPDVVFWAVWGLVVPVVLVMTFANLVRVLRATVIGTA